MTHTRTPAHPRPASRLAAIRELRAAATSCADTPSWSTPDDELLAAVAEAHAAQQAVTALLLELVQQADVRSLPKIQKHVGTSAWLAGELRITVPAARRLAKRARQVCARPRLAAALRTATINADQAGAIAHAVHDLPATLGASRADAAETMLIAEAGRLDACRLGRATGHVLDLLDPAGADARETARRDRRTASATGRHLSVSPTHGGDGVRLSGILDARSAAVLDAALTRHGGAPPTGRDAASPTTDRLRADALIEVCRLALTAPRLRRHAPAEQPAGVVIALDKPRTRIPSRSARKRAKAPHHHSGKSNPTRRPTRG